jgi:Transglycosylase SLT domain
MSSREPTVDPIAVARLAETDGPRSPRIPVAPGLAGAGLGGIGWIAVSAVLVALVLAALGAHPQPPSFWRSAPSPSALADIPPTFLEIYRRAADDHGLDWSVLAAIGKVESDHGRSRLPGVQSGFNCAGAAGPMQLGVGAGDHGCGDAGDAWATYAVDGDGDGRRDVYDPADSIPAAARYLRAAGAPDDYRRAIFAYNHAAWYVAEILATAERYRGLSTGQPNMVHRVPFFGRWLALVPGTTVRCDARIVDDVVYMIRRFTLTVTACFAAAGHAIGGEHPLGLAIDAVPADGDWSHTLAAARMFGWSPACAATGCAANVRPPMRVVLYSGYPGHGDPTHCAPPACAPHLHLSWAHGSAEPLTPAPWVATLAT